MRGYTSLIKTLENNGFRKRANELAIRFKVDELNNWARKNKLTIRCMSGEKLIITDQGTGEEYVVEDLGYPF